MYTITYFESYSNRLNIIRNISYIAAMKIWDSLTANDVDEKRLYCNGVLAEKTVYAVPSLGVGT
jgi:hypothetical protein